MGFIIGIDATNLRQGGGCTHLIELLRVLNPLKNGIDRVIVWSSSETLAQLEKKSWLSKITPREIEKGFLAKSYWRIFRMSKEARIHNCDILFIPGGSFFGNFNPVVTMCRNMLPFEWRELIRFGFSFVTIRLLFLRLAQSASFRKAQGVIFLSDYAHKKVVRTNTVNLTHTIIPHGVDKRFSQLPKKQKNITDYHKKLPLRIIYVSNIEVYKHQWHVVKAISILFAQTKWPIYLELIGPANPRAFRMLQNSLRKFDYYGEHVSYIGEVSFYELHQLYARSDIGIFASSCENLPNILLETMAAGLPIACSDRGPMPEILGDAGVYFDPENAESIADALRILIESPALRSELAHKAYERTLSFTWERCAEQTFDFIHNCYQSSQK